MRFPKTVQYDASQPIHFGSSPLAGSPLESDRLTRIEFERRYNAMPHYAELIEGTVYISPAF